MPRVLNSIRLNLKSVMLFLFAGEMIASTDGLAYRIAESGYRLNIPRMFAALLLLSLTGIAIFALLSWLTHLALRRWHESAIARET